MSILKLTLIPARDWPFGVPDLKTPTVSEMTSERILEYAVLHLKDIDHVGTGY